MEIRLALFSKLIFFFAFMPFMLVYGENEVLPLTAPQPVIDQKLTAELAEMFKNPNFKEFLSDNYQQLHKVSDQGLRPLDPQALQEEQDRKRFYAEYLAKYYPKVFVIRSRFFAHMTLDQMTAALQEIVDVFTEKPWFYFVDKQDNFVVVRYWEYIVDQLSFVSDFLRKAYADVKAGTVVVPQPGVGFFGSPFRFLTQAQRTTIRPLLAALNERQKKSIYEFYALSFDYLIKLFNEGILLKDTRLASRFLHDLEFVMNKLQGSEFEPDYYEVLKTCKELLNILKHKYGVEEYDDVDDESLMRSGGNGMRVGY
ncbi:hypothetical protein JST56_01590 [Candidatus Dependentiae bacterium]|jgi:hypothetical protein|nr:hypothetical protein [Candidatus Dependentiae bacterium]